MKKALNPSSLLKDLFNLMTCTMNQDEFSEKYGEHKMSIEPDNSLIVVGDEDEDDDIVVISVD